MVVGTNINGRPKCYATPTTNINITTVATTTSTPTTTTTTGKSEMTNHLGHSNSAGNGNLNEKIDNDDCT